MKPTGTGQQLTPSRRLRRNMRRAIWTLGAVLALIVLATNGDLTGDPVLAAVLLGIVTTILSVPMDILGGSSRASTT